MRSRKDGQREGMEPRQTFGRIPWWPSRFCYCEGNICEGFVGATGVRGHGMYIRLVTEHERSRGSRANASGPRPRVGEQGPKAKLTSTILRREVRCVHSSEEAG